MVILDSRAEWRTLTIGRLGRSIASVGPREGCPLAHAHHKRSLSALRCQHSSARPRRHAEQVPAAPIWPSASPFEMSFRMPCRLGGRCDARRDTQSHVGRNSFECGGRFSGVMLKILTHTGCAEPLSDIATPIVCMRQAAMLPRGRATRRERGSREAPGESGSSRPKRVDRSGTRAGMVWVRPARVT